MTALEKIRLLHKVRALKEPELKQIFCAATGWHSGLNNFAQKPTEQQFNEYYDQIEVEWDEDATRWIITGEIAQIELTTELYFRCGMAFVHEGKGGTAFDLLAVAQCLKNLGLFNFNMPFHN